jgi:hypothetical protein
MKTFALTATEKKAFRWVRDQLRAGKFKHVKDTNDIEIGKVSIQTRLANIIRYFNMSNWAGKKENNCGTVCCIGGWVEAKIGKPLRPSLLGNANDLFHPYEIDYWDNITPKQAARAIDRYLKDGDADHAWSAR